MHWIEIYYITYYIIQMYCIQDMYLNIDIYIYNEYIIYIYIYIYVYIYICLLYTTCEWISGKAWIFGIYKWTHMGSYGGFLSHEKSQDHGFQYENGRSWLGWFGLSDPAYCWKQHKLLQACLSRSLSGMTIIPSQKHVESTILGRNHFWASGKFATSYCWSTPAVAQ